MDIPALSMAMSQAHLQTDVGTAMLAKSLDMSEVVSEGITDLIDSASMEHSVMPHLGGNLDTLV